MVRKFLKKTADFIFCKERPIAQPKSGAYDEVFCRIYEQCRPYTMTSRERMFALYQAVNYVIESKIDGDFVECGVWRGGSSMLMASTLTASADSGRKMFLYDTFQGMPAPTVYDTSLVNGKGAEEIWRKKQGEEHNEWCYAGLEEVKNNLLSTGYPADDLFFVPGKVEDTIPSKIPGKIAILRLDTDWFESTLHELEYLYPLLAKGGVLIVDDYGHWAGAKKAVDQYFLKHNIHMLLCPVDYTGRLGIKL